MTENFTSDEKHMAMLAVVTALARSLILSGALDRTVWHGQLSDARNWLSTHNDSSIAAYDDLMDMLKKV